MADLKDIEVTLTSAEIRAVIHVITQVPREKRTEPLATAWNKLAVKFMQQTGNTERVKIDG